MTEVERPRLGVIAGDRPALDPHIDHLLKMPELCPYSHNSGPGSTLRLSYMAGAWILELFALEAYLPGFIAHPVVRDNELLAQTVATEAAEVLGVPIEVELDLKVAGLKQRRRVPVRAG